MALTITRRSPRNAVKPGFRAETDGEGTVQLMVYDEIGYNYWTGGGITAKAFQERLKDAGTYSRIQLRINSPGGDAFEGVAIGNFLKSLKKPIDVYVDGVAASAASIVAMCGSKIVMANNALMMIHKAYAQCVGNDDDMTTMANALSKVDGAIAQTYVDRAKQPMDKVKAMMSAETWMGSQEAVDLGFADEIGTEDPGAGDPMAMARTFKAMARYKNLPKQLKPDAQAQVDTCACACEACKDGECYACDNSMCNDPECMDCPMETTPQPGNSIKNAKAKTKRVDGEDLTAGDFIIAKDKEDPKTWKLPWHFSTEEKTVSHLRNALSRFSQLKGVTAEEKATAWKKLVRLCKQYDIEVSEDDKKNAWKNEQIPAADCECSCTSCGGGDCSGCTNPDCDDPDCVDCPYQQGPGDKTIVPGSAEAAAAQSNLSLFRAKQWLLEHRA